MGVIDLATIEIDLLTAHRKLAEEYTFQKELAEENDKKYWLEVAAHEMTMAERDTLQNQVAFDRDYLAKIKGGLSDSLVQYKDVIAILLNIAEKIKDYKGDEDLEGTIAKGRDLLGLPPI